MPSRNRSRSALCRVALGAFALAGWLAITPDAAARQRSAAVVADADNDAAAPQPGSGRPRITVLQHRVVPYESLEDIAKRYGVTVDELKAWNRILKGKVLKAGWELKIRARIAPPPRKKITYTVVFGDTWGEIATRFNVPEGDLHRWNPKVARQFRAGQRLTVYTNPKPRNVTKVSVKGPDGVPEEEELEDDTALPQFDVPPGGVSIGSPNRGRLSGGVQLPESDLYTVRRPEESWGSSHTILQLQTAIADFRRDSGFRGELLIGAISLENGGRFRPHRSHQSGRDVDIRLPKRAGASRKSDAPSDIDWGASWELIQSFVETGEVEYIFLDYSRQKRLLEAARDAGATASEIEKIIQYPRGRSKNAGVVRHAEGHLIHIHVRIKCPSTQARCES